MAMTEKLVFRRADATDLDLITSIEATCFPAAEAATRDQFAERLAAYGDHFWILEADGKAVGFIDGMVTNQETISDDLFADASKHNPTGDWAAVSGLMCFLVSVVAATPPSSSKSLLRKRRTKGVEAAF